MGGVPCGGECEREKDAKYHELAKTYTFIPIACETLGPINTKALTFLAYLGRRIALVTHAKDLSLFNASSLLFNVLTLCA